MIYIVTKLDLDPNGRAYCTLLIQERHSKIMTPLSFKVDTGADFTTVSKASLHSLGYDREWIEANKKIIKSKVITLASGEKVNTYFIQLPLINLYGYGAINWPFAVMLDDKMDYRQLLGLNLLSYFNVKVDNDSGLCELSHIIEEPKGEIIFNDQKIYKIGDETPCG